MWKTPKDGAVIRRLYQENAKKLYFVAWSIVQNDTKAEEAVCTCFRKLAEDFAKCSNQDYENLERLSVILVKNAAAKMTDGHNGEAGYAKGSEREISRKCVDMEAESTMTRAVKQLAEDERNLLFLQHVLQLGPKVIGSLLDMEAKEARKKLVDCNEKLSAVLEGMSA